MDPGIVAGGVISDEIEDETDFAGMQFLAGAVERVPGSDTRVWNILHNGVRRADYVVWREAGKSVLEIWEICRIFEGDAARNGASLPHSHKPDGVESELSYCVPFSVGNGGEVDVAAKAPGKLCEPSPGVYFVKMRVRAKRKTRRGISWDWHGNRE